MFGNNNKRYEHSTVMANKLTHSFQVIDISLGLNIPKWKLSLQERLKVMSIMGKTLYCNKVLNLKTGLFQNSAPDGQCTDMEMKSRLRKWASK